MYSRFLNHFWRTSNILKYVEGLIDYTAIRKKERYRDPDRTRNKPAHSRRTKDSSIFTKRKIWIIRFSLKK